MSRPVLLCTVKLHYAWLKVKFKLPKPRAAGLPASGAGPTVYNLLVLWSQKGKFHLRVYLCNLADEMLPFGLTSRIDLVRNQLKYMKSGR